jgi:uncharacterized membrane protein
MKFITRYWLAAVLVAASFAVAALFYDRVPDPVPAHWSFAGQVDGWMAKPLGVFAVPLLALLVSLLVAVLPDLAPRRFATAPLQRVYPTIVAALAGLMLLVTFASLRAATGAGSSPQAGVLAGLGVFCVVVGNVLGKLTRNFFVGIRTPWTLANSQVWERTHRFAGPVFVIGGILLVSTSLSNVSRAVTMLLLGLIFLTPVVYSYLAWRHIDRSGG